MGVRVHKVIGYGLTDVEFDESTNRLVDPRINKRGLIGLYDRDYDLAVKSFTDKGWRKFLVRKLRETKKRKRASWELKSYLACERQIRKHIEKQYPDRDEWGPLNSVVLEPEYGPKDLLLVPPEMMYGRRDRWYRDDDTIDWVEETMEHEQLPRLKVYRWRTLPPYDRWIDDRTGRRVSAKGQWPDPRTFAEVCSRDSHWAPKGTAKDKRAMRRRYNKDAVALGFDNLTDARRHMIPEIPTSLRMFCEFARIFTKRSTIFQLRPMLYVYWS